MNEEDWDGEWAVERFLDASGPPEHRFWKVLWAGELPSDCGQTTSPVGCDDTGGFDCNWQPVANIARCPTLTQELWEAHVDMDGKDVVKRRMGNERYEMIGHYRHAYAVWRLRSTIGSNVLL